MASTIKSDNGVSSGVTGIVQTADSSGQLAFQTTSSGGSAVTALTINNSQQVGVGVTPVGADSRFVNVEVGASTSVSDIVVSSTNLLTYVQHNSYVSGGSTYFKYTGGSNYASQYSQNNGNHIFQSSSAAGTGPSTAVTFNTLATFTPAGNLTFGQSNAGIVFNNSSATTNSTLNDYETGTWTPVKGSGLTTTGTFSSSGTYTKIGRLVNVSFLCQATTISFSSGQQLLLTGLPFTEAAVGGFGVLAISNLNINAQAYTTGIYSNSTSGGSSSQFSGTITYTATF